MEKDFKITSSNGLHARPATSLVKKANEFKCDLFLEHNGVKVNLKSIMGVLSLGLNKGSEIIISAIGEDEEEAIKTITKVIDEINLK